jgi:hypothetical protein
MSATGEVVMWKPVTGYEDRYEVSSFGEVRKKATKTLVGQWANSNGYMIVRLSKPRKQFRVHRLVALAFISNPNDKSFINHIDANKSNNSVGNLEWCDQLGNLNHARALGRIKDDYWVGKRSPNAKLSNEMAKVIKDEYKNGKTSWIKLSKKYNVNKRTVGRIIKGESYV